MVLLQVVDERLDARWKLWKRRTCMMRVAKSASFSRSFRKCDDGVNGRTLKSRSYIFCRFNKRPAKPQAPTESGLEQTGYSDEQSDIKSILFNQPQTLTNDEMAPNSRIILTRHAQAEHNVDLDYTSQYLNHLQRHRDNSI